MASMPLAFLVLALAAISPASEDAQIANAEAALGGKAAEHDTVALAGSHAQNERDALVLVLNDGKHVRFANDRNCMPYEQDGCTVHSLAAFLPSRGVFVVENIYY